MASKNTRRKKRVALPTVAVILLLLAAVVWYLFVYYFAPDVPGTDRESGTDTESVLDSLQAASGGNESVYISDSGDGDTLSIHFLELGNYYTGDCTYIKAGDVDILIDAGSRPSSVGTITAYLDEYVTDGILEYVIVTHAHQDHYACFAGNKQYASLFDIYTCETVIDFAQVTASTAKGTMYQNYQRQLSEAVEAGATHYTAAECVQSGNNVFELGEDLTLTILDSAYYYTVASSENDHSVCCLITQGDRNFLFTGDLEEKGERELILRNELPQVTLYKAGHHGSKTSSSKELMAVIRPEIVCVCCCAGSPEYTNKNENQFPTQIFVDNIAPYTDRVYVTSLYNEAADGKYESMNGNIMVTSAPGTLVTVTCSVSDRPLYLWEWFRKNRKMPDAWKKE